MADAGAGRHDAEILERALRPFEKPVALLVLLVLFLDILFERGVGAEIIDHHRMIDDEVDRHQRIDLLRIAAEHLHGVAHGGEIDDSGDAGEILHQHARRPEREFAVRGFGLEPLRHGLDVLFGHRPAVLIAQQIFKQHLERKWQPRNPLEAVLFRHRQAVIRVGLGPYLERPEAFEAVERGHDYFPILPAARRRESQANLSPEQAPTERWWPDAESVTNAPLAAFRLIGSFQDLCQIGKNWRDNMPGLAGSHELHDRTGLALAVCTGHR